MSTPFLQQFYQAQQLTLELQKEVSNLEKSGQTYLNQLKASDFANDDVLPNDNDPELGGGTTTTTTTAGQQNSINNNPLMKRILSITALIQRIRVITYQCDELVSNNIERTKLGQIEQQCNEAEALVMRFRARLSEKRRQLEMDTYLFGPKRGQSMMFGGTHIETNKGDQNETQSLIGNGFNKNDFYNNEQDSLNNALKTMNNALNNAYESINSLDRQREMFHNIQRRTAEIMDQLGFSKQVIGWISRQENTNTIITFLGMFITLFIVIVFYYYWKA